ncbi:MAG: hypothetical protein QNJ12_23495, partial [Ilumatobacter sp.]
VGSSRVLFLSEFLVVLTKGHAMAHLTGGPPPLLPPPHETPTWSTVSPFANEEEAVAFVREGERLAIRMQSELGESWNVEYYPEPTKPSGGFTQR